MVRSRKSAKSGAEKVQKWFPAKPSNAASPALCFSICIIHSWRTRIRCATRQLGAIVYKILTQDGGGSRDVESEYAQPDKTFCHKRAQRARKDRRGILGRKIMGQKNGAGEAGIFATKEHTEHKRERK